MELVLEHDEIEALIRVGLEAKGVHLPAKCTTRIRRNGKKDTLRIVFVGVWKDELPPKRGKENCNGK